MGVYLKVLPDGKDDQLSNCIPAWRKFLTTLRAALEAKGYHGRQKLHTIRWRYLSIYHKARFLRPNDQNCRTIEFDSEEALSHFLLRWS